MDDPAVTTGGLPPVPAPDTDEATLDARKVFLVTTGSAAAFIAAVLIFILLR